MNAIPQILKSNDGAAIASTARKINLKDILPALDLYSSWGLNVRISNTIGKECNQFAGSDKERAEDLQRLFDDKDIKAVFCARGGYGTARILDSLDYGKFLENPKWLVGYSDVTALLMHLYYKYSAESIHGTMPVDIKNRQTCPAYETLKSILFENKTEISAPYNTMNVCSSAEGDLIGGNLSVMYSLLGSESFGDTAGKVLIIEDLDEYIYHIDRMMTALKRAGKLSGLKALLVGEFVKLHDNDIPFGKDYRQVIYDSVAEYHIPVAFDIPVGHIGTRNCAFIHGHKARIEITEGGTLIQQ